MVGLVLTSMASFSIIDFSQNTFSNVDSPVKGVEVVKDVYKFDFPFLRQTRMGKTINQFKIDHPELKINSHIHRTF